tara:strand:+ start:156 stop:1133 length:978 start_codon:yes stop_codon:yes gene_type:complete
MDIIGQDEFSQNRLADSDTKKVTQLADQLSSMGQDLGICVLYIRETNTLVIRWGNTRWRGAKEIYKRSINNEIPDCPANHIWASLYEEPASELPRLQARENNIHKINSPAKLEDNARSLITMADSGLLDNPGSRFSDLGDEEKKERVRNEVKATMPNWKGRKFDTLWNNFRSKKKSTFQTTSFTVSEEKTYFSKHNRFGIKDADKDKETKGHGKDYNYKVTDPDTGKELTIGVRFVYGDAMKGANLQGSYAAKNVNKYCDYNLWIVGVKVNTSSQLPASRDTFVKAVKKFNDAQKDTTWVDEIWFLPQTQPERSTKKAYVKEIKF